jgi:TetR/AcrR family transcriptional regulator, transcriptional repressor for nem operon
MARYAAGQKVQTRQRMIKAAGRRFKRDGIDGSGVASLMADVGLTNGAFYAHFTSKDDLVATVVTDQLGTQYSAIDALPPGRPALERFVRDYLSPEHRDHPGDGCPSAALLDEIGRRDDSTRQAYTSGISAIIDLISRRLDASDPDRAQDRAIGVFAVLVSTLQLARAVSDSDLSDRILSAGIANAINLVS